MIIQINATVCAAADHGEDRQHKIAGSDQRNWVLRSREEASDQGNRKIRGTYRGAGSSEDDGFDDPAGVRAVRHPAVQHLAAILGATGGQAVSPLRTP